MKVQFRMFKTTSGNNEDHEVGYDFLNQQKRTAM